MNFDDQEDAEQEMPLPVPSGHDPIKIGEATPATKSGGGARYRECLKNHAVGIGGHAVDGCGEFMAAGNDGTLDALLCAACSCHRNFHRKETDHNAGDSAIAGVVAGAYHSQFSPYYRTPTAGYHHQLAAAAAAAAAQHHQRAPPALALPSTSGGRSGDEHDDMLVVAGKKRFRTKFSQDQKEKMLFFAEGVGWRIQKHDESAVEQFCSESGVKRHVLKVWMHNNKHTLGKKT